MKAEPIECPAHVHPLDLVETPDRRQGREGWVRCVCRKCGKLIGYRPTFEIGKARRSRATFDELARDDGDYE